MSAVNRSARGCRLGECRQYWEPRSGTDAEGRGPERRHVVSCPVDLLPTSYRHREREGEARDGSCGAGSDRMNASGGINTPCDGSRRAAWRNYRGNDGLTKQCREPSSGTLLELRLHLPNRAFTGLSHMQQRFSRYDCFSVCKEDMHVIRHIIQRKSPALLSWRDSSAAPFQGHAAEQREPLLRGRCHRRMPPQPANRTECATPSAGAACGRSGSVTASASPSTSRWRLERNSSPTLCIVQYSQQIP